MRYFPIQKLEDERSSNQNILCDRDCVCVCEISVKMLSTYCASGNRMMIRQSFSLPLGLTLCMASGPMKVLSQSVVSSVVEGSDGKGAPHPARGVGKASWKRWMRLILGMNRREEVLDPGHWKQERASVRWGPEEVVRWELWWEWQVDRGEGPGLSHLSPGPWAKSIAQSWCQINFPFFYFWEFSLCE